MPCHRTHRALLALPLLAASLAAQQIESFHFDLTTLGGQRIQQSQFEHSVLLVDFWGTWCGPCVSAVPALQRMYAKYKHHGLEIVGFAYENAPPEQAAAQLREFAAARGLTYPLALGTPAEKAQVPGFRGYPTLLFFGRGLQFRKLDVGFGPEFERELERWIRVELGLDAPAPEGDPAAGGDERRPAPPDAFDEPDDTPEPLPAGVIFKPGDGDVGFAFEEDDVDGQTLRFADLRGAPVVLALTSTWDPEAVHTSELLQALHRDYSERGVHVIAASLELARDRQRKVAAIAKFREEHGLRYRLFPAGLAFQKKIHLFTGVPLLLVFDGDGTLVLRENGASDEIAAKVRAAVDAALPKDGG
ncbi:MAG: TlpA family protein disulfide reductase [Planctomycetes bacterium]|nr:TlpA family protein disulfide reductase [Planctomycetota bacterium]